MKKFLLLLLIAAPFALFHSCKHEILYPEQQVSFSADILPIIQSSCQHSGCHDTLGGEFPLTNYNNIMDKGEVKPGDPRHSKLYEVITGKGEEMMPPAPYPPLTDRQIKLILIWIGQGAKNN